MGTTRKNIVILLLTILLILVIQLIRLDLVLSLNSLSNTPDYVYYPEQASSLSASERNGGMKRHGLVICDATDANTIENIQAVLKNLQITADFSDLKLPAAEPGQYDLIILVESDSAKTDEFDRLVRFGQESGHMLFLGNSTMAPCDIPAECARELGILARGRTGTAGGIIFYQEILSGLTGKLSFSDEPSVLPRIITPRQVKLTDDCTVIASDATGNPLIWRSGSNQGIMVMNTGSYDNKRLRGLLTGAVSLLLETVIYPVSASAVYQVMDFAVDDRFRPDVLAVNYNRNYSQYALDIWWRDMNELMRRYQIKYTLAYIATLSGDIAGPYKTPGKAKSNFSAMTGTILKNGGEISFQGFNQHAFLMPGGSFPAGTSLWPDLDSMTASVQCGMSFLKRLMPNYQVRVYVPPDGQFDSAAVIALKSGMPDFETISGAYFDQPLLNAEEPGALFCQDFSAHEEYGSAFPFITEGGYPEAGILFDMASAVTEHGIVNHVFRTGDILQDAGGRGILWEGLYEEYDRLLRQVSAKYGWLIPETVTSASEKQKQADSLDLYYAVDGHQIKIACGGLCSEATLMLLTTKTIKSATGCVYEKIDSLRYLVTVHDKTAVLEVD